MFDNLPSNPLEYVDWQWEDYAPYFDDLIAREVTEDNINQWLIDWSKMVKGVWEAYARLNVAVTVDTNDEESDAKHKNFIRNIFPQAQKATFQLNQKLVQSEIVPEGMEIPMRNIESALKLFNEANLPLQSKLSELGTKYNRITGAQTIEWDGEEQTLMQVRKVFFDTDRERREKAWLLTQERMREDREAYNDLWRELMDIRKQMTENVGLDDYRQYAWLERNRHDYDPEDALEFVEAIEKVVVPVVAELREKRRQTLGVDALRPWDTEVDAEGREALKPYETIEDFEAQTEKIFMQVDPELGDYFKTMREEKLLDLDNRKGKAPGGYCTFFATSNRPFIFMNAVGAGTDVRTLLHEAGHAFHGFSSSDLPFMQQRRAPMEFNEVAAMAMELLALPYVTQDNGGYFDENDTKRYVEGQLERILEFWPYMATVVAFQHWIYTNHELATDPTECDRKWVQLWNRFMVGIDWSGYEDFIVNRWRRQLHIFRVPFYYIEYGLAQLGAVQVWERALSDQAQALADYRSALELGGTVKLPELYERAGVKLAFDAEKLQSAVDLITSHLDKAQA